MATTIATKKIPGESNGATPEKARQAAIARTQLKYVEIVHTQNRFVFRNDRRGAQSENIALQLAEAKLCARRLAMESIGFCSERR